MATTTNKVSAERREGMSKKPPIGAAPSWYVIPNRIKELSEAIARYTEHERMGIDLEVTSIIKQWATEINYLCDALDEIQKIKKESDKNDRTRSN